MTKRIIILLIALLSINNISAQINTDRVTLIGRNALYFEDYLLSIQYFNQVIKAKPYLADPYFYRAVSKYYLDDYQGAEEDCSKCIERNPFYTKAYQLRADARQSLKKYDEALNDYKFSLKNDPDNKFILINIGIVNIEKKAYDSAEVVLNRLVETNPNYTQGVLTRGNLYLEKGDTIKAIEDFNYAINKDKYFAPSYSIRGSVYLAQGKYDTAIEDYNEAIKLDPLLIENYINRGLTKYYKKNLRGAMADYDYVIKIDPSNTIAHFNRALLRAQVGDDNKAIEDFNYVIKHEPDNYIAYMNRGILKNNIGDQRGALKDINKVLEKHPDFYQGYMLRSEIKRKQNNMKGAETDYLYALKTEKKVRKEVLSGKKAKDQIREESDETIDKFNLLVVADKDEAQKSKYKNNIRGQIQNKQTNTDLEPMFIVTYYERKSELQKYTHFNPEVEEMNKSEILKQRLLITNREVPLDSTQVATHFNSINEYSKQIAENPTNKYYYFARGLDYILVQDYQSAIEDLTRATNIDPQFTLAYFNLAVAYTKQIKSKERLPELWTQEPQSELSINMQLGDKTIQTNGTTNTPDLDAKVIRSRLDYSLILKNYTKALELSPDFKYIYYNKAGIKATRQDYRAAILDYNEALKRDSEFAEARYNRGINRLRIQDTKKGLDDLRKAGELGIVNAYSIIKRMTKE